MRKLSLLNQRFGRLVVIELDNNKKEKVMWKCKCDCGNITYVSTSNLRAGRIKSCGCLKLERLLERSTTHNQRHTYLYEVWKSLRQRCNNPKNSSYHNYGGRGIKVCDEWNNSFQAFYDWSYSNGYSIENQKDEVHKLTLDRIDVNGNYEPSNCRWVDRKTQARNTRLCKLITYNGETRCLSEWCEILNLKYPTISNRFRYGWTPERAFETPIKKTN